MIFWSIIKDYLLLENLVEGEYLAIRGSLWGVYFRGENLVGVWPPAWVGLEAHLEQLKGSLLGPREEGLQGNPPEPGKGPHMMREGGELGPVLDRGEAQEAEDLENLVDLRLTLEQHLASQHLSENTADRPDIQIGAVVPLPQKNLRGSVPESNHVLSQTRHWKTEAPRQPEVGYFSNSIWIH